MDDPRERLKRYLEQRKELGERELVLDGMTVDEVMNIVGALGGRNARQLKSAPRKPMDVDSADPGTAASSSVTEGASGPPGLSPRGVSPAPPPSRAGEGVAPPVADWRQALLASGATPQSKSPLREAKAARDTKPVADSKPVAGPTPPAIDRAAGAVGEPPVDPPVAPKPPAAAPPSKRYEFPRPIDADVGSAGDTEGLSPARASAPGAATSAGAPAGASPGAQRVPGVDAPLGIVVGNADRDLFGTSVGKLATLAEIAEVVAGCQRCPLYATATNPVPGEGNPAAELVVVGEAPGANEDATGRPFVGQSGELLTKILAAISLKREDVFICNVLKHRPPGNRNPLPEEVVACSPYLVQQLELIRPKVIVAFGTFAAQTLLNTKLPIGKLRGSIHRYHGVPLIVTYHPAALLRNPAWKRPTWEDVQLARRILDNAPRA